MTIRLVRSFAASIGANRSAIEETQFPETGMFAMPHDHVVKNLDLEELSGADEIAGDADVRLGRSWFAAGMIMLCDQPSYVQFAVGGSDKNAVFGTKGVSWIPMNLPRGVNPDASLRTLKIEADGDRWKGDIKPKIHLMGCWLQRAGFRPGDRVQVTCIAPGVIELRSTDATMVNG